MDEDKAIIPAGEPITGNEEWNEIANRISAELTVDNLPDRVIEATELLLAGWPIYKAARKLNVSSDTIRRWLSTYPTMAAAVANGRKLLSKWRMSKLEQQFLSAIERSQEVLELDLDGTNSEGNKVDPKVLTVVAAQARYIIGLFSGQKIDVEVRHELGDTLLKAKEDALSYLADRLAEQQVKADSEPVEAVFRIIDSKRATTGPVLDEHGDPPFGKLGQIDKTDDGILCHICGGRYKSVIKHLLTAHDVTVEDYETLYMLEEGSLRKTEGY